jgi:hypothetical protein
MCYKTRTFSRANNSGSSTLIPESPKKPKQLGTESVEIATVLLPFTRVAPRGLPFAKVSLCIRIELALPLFGLASYARTFPKGSSTD